MRCIIAFAIALFSFSALAAEPSNKTASAPAANYLEGKEYTLLDAPVRPQDPNKIEVTEVFSYTCSHCFHFEPIISAWAKTQKADVTLVQSHINWNAGTAPYQRGYYTTVLLKLKDKTHQAIFDNLHRDNKPLGTAEAWADFLAPYGVAKATVLSTYNSFAVNSLIAQADSRNMAYKVTGTPEMIVDGRYHISTRNLASQEDMLKVADFLIAKVRAERATQKP